MESELNAISRSHVMGRMEWFNYLKKVFNKLIADNSSMSPEPTDKISITMMCAGIE